MAGTTKMTAVKELEEAYKYCEKITKLHAKSFYFAAKFLPQHKQKAVYPIYAFCRHVDDEVDETNKENHREGVQAVEKWKEKLEKVYEQSEEAKGAGEEDDEILSPVSHPSSLVLIVWRDLLKTYKIPRKLPLELMRGVLMDTYVKRYETFDELYVYCYRVASTVGLMSSEILGYSDEKTLEYAEAMGVGMQLTNILRDIKEDAAMGRIYLPREDLRKYDVSEKQIFANEFDEKFARMMKFQIERARDFYHKGERGIALLEKDSHFTVLLAARIYGKILDEIEAQNYDVFKRRARTTKIQKIAAIPKIWREARNL